MGYDVYETEFSTKVTDYCFHFFVTWVGGKKAKLGLQLNLYSKVNVHMEPFRMRYMLEIRDGEGT